jgi:hypothetical protein
MTMISHDEVFATLSMPGREDIYSPARWICHPTANHESSPGQPVVLAFRRRFATAQPVSTRLHVSADQRYELFLDGHRLGRGPHRGDLAHWFYESYTLDLAAGEHVLAARVWWLPGRAAPMAQITAEAGFVALAEGDLATVLSTGSGWEVMALNAYENEPYEARAYHVVGWSFDLDGARYPWDWSTDSTPSAPWVPAAVGRMPVGGRSNPYYNPEEGHRTLEHHLTPPMLPPMIEKTRHLGTVRHAEQVAGRDLSGPVLAEHHDEALAARWQALLRGEENLRIEPQTRIRLIIDLDDYYCAYPELVTSGGAGASIKLSWAESLYEDVQKHVKGHRDQVEGKRFHGAGDRFRLEGGAHRLYDTLWWRSGRYVEIVAETAAEPVTLERLAWRETRYPLEMEGQIIIDDAQLQAAIPIMHHTLQMCAHETYMDCPYYEQLMYAGDTRLQVLVTYLTTHDDRLPVLANAMFDWSRAPDGLTKSRYPSAVPQVIPPFSLWWVGMVYDHYLWRDRHDLVRDWLPGVSAVLTGFTRYLGGDGLLAGIRGWNFCDWVPAWRGGWPPDGDEGPNALINLMYVYALELAAEMHHHLGELALATHWRGLAERVRQAVVDAYWDQDRGLLADDVDHAHYSEHVQAMAILTHLLDEPRRARMIHGLLNDSDLEQTTIYFSHYLFEALRIIGATDYFYQRLSLWRDLAAGGFKTTLESPEPSRSDCHAWGAHPIYHLYATFLGARPAEPGFRSVRITPQPGPLTVLAGAFPHPSGEMIEFDLRFDGDRMSGSIDLPAALGGSIAWRDEVVPLQPGHNEISL